VPFYPGPAVGTLIQPEAELVIRDRGRLRAFLDGQLRQVRRTDQMPAEALQVVSFETIKTVDGDPVAAAALSDVLAPTDFVLTVGRNGRATGRVFVKVHNGLVKVVGMTK
jgi:hypothetical protein